MDSFHLDFFYCEDCKIVPRLRMNRENLEIEITCNCPKEKCQKKMNLLEFLEELKKGRTTPCCSSHESEQTNNFCANCQKFLCSNCLEEHKKANESHFVINSDGMKISNICENQGCQGKLLFFCKECQIHMCEECKGKHSPKHQIIDLAEKFPEANIQGQCDSISEWETEMKNYYKKYEDALDDLQKSIERRREELAVMRKDGENITNFFKSLASTYATTKGILNYNVLSNLQENDLQSFKYFPQKTFYYEYPYMRILIILSFLFILGVLIISFATDLEIPSIIECFIDEPQASAHDDYHEFQLFWMILLAVENTVIFIFGMIL